LPSAHCVRSASLPLLGARYARPPVAYGSLRVGCASLPSVRLCLTPRRLRLLSMAFGQKCGG